MNCERFQRKDSAKRCDRLRMSRAVSGSLNNGGHDDRTETETETERPHRLDPKPNCKKNSRGYNIKHTRDEMPSLGMLWNEMASQEKERTGQSEREGVREVELKLRLKIGIGDGGGGGGAVADGVGS